MDDRRVAGRSRPLNQLAVTNAATGEDLGVVQDLTMGGIRLVRDLALEPETSLTLSIAIPPGMVGQAVLIEASCCWCVRRHERNSWEAGLEFASSEPPVLKRIAV